MYSQNEMNLGYVHTDRLQYNTETDTNFYEHPLFIDIGLLPLQSMSIQFSVSISRSVSVNTPLL